jgi:8-oxo-dGTP pyrophosphatase MutT (NUDIX family)
VSSPDDPILRPWRRVSSEKAHDCRVFELRRTRFEPPDERRAAWFYVLDAPSWINVIPLTVDGRVILIRQYRFGTEAFTLEIPGGMCDGDEPPVEAARRELLEETGYEAEKLVEIGWVHPNPAIQNNRCYTYLATGARETSAPEPDPHEAFERVLVPLDRIPDLISDGSITHALVVAAFHLYDRYRTRISSAS